MSWRVVVISKRSKLELSMNDLVVRGDETKRIHLSEISTLIIESTEVSVTAAILVEATKRKIKIIFCDEKRNPSFELIPYYGSHDTSLKVRTQILWDENIKGEIWTAIAREKILQQANLLKEQKLDQYIMLEEYAKDIRFRDETNREGHAAKVYFNALFGKEFSRTDTNEINAALNYGYSIILSAFNREISAGGYLTQIGLFHDNRFNMFNLGSDLMEPFRPLVDRKVIGMNHDKFESEEKMNMVNLLNDELIIDGKKQYINNAIKIYCKSIFDALNNRDCSMIRFYQNEL